MVRLARSARGFCAPPLDGPVALAPCLDVDPASELVTTVSGDKTIMFLRLSSALDEAKPVRQSCGSSGCSRSRQEHCKGVDRNPPRCISTAIV